MTSSVQSGASRAIIRQKIENKRLLEKASLRAVEALLEEGITEEILRLQCRYLWQNTYQDCAEERAVGRLCGYPLCDNAITAANRTGPRYKICTRRNKVYDLEKRRIFCSDWCYAASEWLKSQLSEVPLWMHEKLPEDACLDLLRKELAPCATKKEHAASLADMSSTSMAENDIYDSADFMFSPRGKRRPTSEVYRLREEGLCNEASLWVPKQLSKNTPFFLLKKKPKLVPLVCQQPEVKDHLKESLQKQEIVSCKQADFKFSPPKRRILVDEIDEEAEELRQWDLDRSTDRNSHSTWPFGITSYQTGSDNMDVGVEDVSSPFTVARLENILNEWITVATLYYIFGRKRVLKLRADFCRGTLPASYLAQNNAISSTAKLSEQSSLRVSNVDLSEIGGSNDLDHKRAGSCKWDLCSNAVEQIEAGAEQKSLSDLLSHALLGLGTPADCVSRASDLSHESLEVCHQDSDKVTLLKRRSASNDGAKFDLQVERNHDQHISQKRKLLGLVIPVVEKFIAPYLGLSLHQFTQELSQLVDTFCLSNKNCMPRQNEVLTISLTLLMLMDKKAGGEGVLPEVFRGRMIELLRTVEFGWYDMTLVLKRATDPKRLFSSFLR